MGNGEQIIPETIIQETPTIVSQGTSPTTGVRNIDPRQLESFLRSEKIIKETSSAELGRWQTHIGRERGKARWIKEGNIILSSGEFIKGEDWLNLSDEQKNLLSKLGVEKYNTFLSTHIRVNDNWYGPGDPLYEVYDAIRDGYRTYDGIRIATGKPNLSNYLIDLWIDDLVSNGYLMRTS